jgi:hypothetical protein
VNTPVDRPVNTPVDRPVEPPVDPFVDRPGLTAVGRAAAVVAAVVAALAAALAVGGPFALVIAAECLAALALVIVLARTPGGGARERGAPRAAAAWARIARRAWPRRRPPAAVVRPADFPSYAKISSDLGWAPMSQWHYDHGIRRLFGRLAESALAERHRVDLTRDPERARHLVGDDIWPLIDPSRPPSFDSKAPGPDLPTLTRIVDRLEQL